jgi:hypothetical protein
MSGGNSYPRDERGTRLRPRGGIGKELGKGPDRGSDEGPGEGGDDGPGGGDRARRTVPDNAVPEASGSPETASWKGDEDFDLRLARGVGPTTPSMGAGLKMPSKYARVR